MFDFFIKRKKVIFDCFTYKSHAYEFAKIDYANSFFPEWWKKTDPICEHMGKMFPTIKKCHGLSEYFNRGIIIPSWFQLQLIINPLRQNEKIEDLIFTWTSSDNTQIENHFPGQYRTFSKNNAVNIKLISPWGLKTNRYVNFVWSQPTWNFTNYLFNVSILPGVLDFYYQHDTNINFLIKTEKKQQKIVIDPRTPLAMLHPLTDSDVVVKNHLVSENEYRSIFSLNKLFVHSGDRLGSLYRNKKTFIDNINANT